MQVNLNSNLNQQNIQFKAKFANTVETKRALKQISEKSPRSVFIAMEALKKAMPNDTITVARRASGYIDIINKTALEKFGEIFGSKFFKTCTDPKSFVNSILEMSLSDNTTVQNHMDQNNNKILEKLENESQSRQTIKDLEIVSSQIARLNANKTRLQEKCEVQETEYVKNLIDSM